MKNRRVLADTAAVLATIQHEQRIDTVSQQRTAVADEQQSSDRVEVTKPPDVPRNRHFAAATRG